MKRARVRIRQVNRTQAGRVRVSAVCPECTKKKRQLTWPLLIIGGWRILFQIITSVNSVRAGTAPWQQAQFLQGGAFWSDLAELLGFLVAGLFGAVLVVLALPRRRMIAAITFALCFTISVGVLAFHAPAEAVQDQVQTGYVVNQRSGMAHHADCMYAAQISDENRVYFTESELDVALTEADTLCSRCFAQMTAMAE